MRAGEPFDRQGDEGLIAELSLDRFPEFRKEENAPQTGAEY
jgi:hypothetical protein